MIYFQCLLMYRNLYTKNLLPLSYTILHAHMYFIIIHLNVQCFQTLISALRCGALCCMHLSS